MAHYPVRSQWLSATSCHEQNGDSCDDVHAREREYVRRELDMFFSTYPTVAEGFQLKTWRSGRHAGQPKLPPPARNLLDRELMWLDADSRPPRLFFTDDGRVELRAMMANRRLADPVQFAHIRREIGIDSV
jgi:hypothetical protein